MKMAYQVHIYGGVEQKPHGSDNQVTVLVNSGASGNYFDDLLVSQLKPPSLDFT